MIIRLGLLAFGLAAALRAQSAANLPFNPEAHSLLQTDRPDGRYLATRGFEQQLLRDLKPQLAFNPAFSPGQMAAWRSAVRSKIRELMHFPEVASRPAPRLLRTEKRRGYRLEKWEIYPEPGSVVTFLALIPDTVTARRPGAAVLCFPGSGGSKEQLAGEPEVDPIYFQNHWPKENAMALQYVQAGLVAVAIENPGTAELSDLERYGRGAQFDYDSISRVMLELGRSYLSLSAYQKLQALDWLRHRDYVDPKRIALSAHSLGTEPLMVIGLLDPDIAAFVSNDFVCNTLERARVMTKPAPDGTRPPPNTIHHLVPGFWLWFDLPDLLAALSPRPLLITEGGEIREITRIRRAYEIAGTPGNLTVYFYPKFSDPASRSAGVMPEGLDQAGFLKMANVDAPHHYFKGNLAVPWLSGILAGPR